MKKEMMKQCTVELEGDYMDDLAPVVLEASCIYFCGRPRFFAFKSVFKTHRIATVRGVLSRQTC